MPPAVYAGQVDSRLLALAALVAFAGCPYPPPGEVRVEEGSLPVGPGASVSFALYCDELFSGWELTAGPGQCGHDWQVQGVTGGSADYGTITDCGVYTAPADAPPEPIDILGTECPWGDWCSDACGALLTLDLDGFAQVSARSAP